MIPQFMRMGEGGRQAQVIQKALKFRIGLLSFHFAFKALFRPVIEMFIELKMG